MFVNVKREKIMHVVQENDFVNVFIQQKTKRDLTNRMKQDRIKI